MTSISLKTKPKFLHTKNAVHVALIGDKYSRSRYSRMYDIHKKNVTSDTGSHDIQISYITKQITALSR